MPALRKNFTYTLCSFLLVLFYGQPLFAQSAILEKSLPADTFVEELFEAGGGLPVGKIQAMRGEVIVYHRDSPVTYRVKSGLPLYHGDTIRTGKAGRVLCRLIDGTTFSLLPETTLAILQCSHNTARKTSVSFLSLKHGSGRFQVSPPAEIFSHEFKIQTVTAFVQAGSADFFIRANREKTGIVTFENSRLEVTSLAEPEEIFFLTDFQKTAIADKLGPQLIETVTQEESAAIIAETRLYPQNKLFASSPEKYSEGYPIAETLESGNNVTD